MSVPAFFTTSKVQRARLLSASKDKEEPETLICQLSVLQQSQKRSSGVSLARSWSERVLAMADANPPPESMAEDEANSVFSHEDGEGGSSGDDTTHNSGPAETGKKRKREKYQKTS